VTVDRTDPSTTAPERDMLEQWLDFHRATLEMKCEGLDPEQLRRRSVSPTTLTLLGLVRHMAEVERGWFRNIFRGEGAPDLFCSDEDPDGDFDDLDSVPPNEALAIWHEECDHAREVFTAAGLDEIGKDKSPRSGKEFSMRWIMLHMIEEYARHNGHADLIREAIDGATGD
jgi:uncharacterized damage-inducible protein DinB